MCCFYLSKLNFTTGCLSSILKTRIYIVGTGVSNVFMQGMNQRCVCLANGLLCTDVCKCKDCNNNKQDQESDCDNLVEEENVY